MKNLRLAVVGAGHLGTIHTRLIRQQPQVDLQAVIDPSQIARERIQSEFNVPTYAQLDAYNGPLDAAIIAAPSCLHYEIATALIRRGVHLLIEKPLATELTQATILEQLAYRFGVCLSVGHVERFNPAFQAIKQQIGRVRYIDAQRLSSFSYRSTDIGAVLDLMIHDLDMIGALIEGDPVRIDATGRAFVSRQEDFAQARLEFSDGAVANLTASRCNTSAKREWRVIGDRAMATVDLSSHQVELIELPVPGDWEIDGHELTMAEKQAARDQFFTDVLPRRVIEVAPCNAIQAEHTDWLDAIRNGRSPIVDATSACRSLDWAEKILRCISHQGIESEANIVSFPRAA